MIINGNCFDFIDRCVEESTNPIIVTDPPFNVGYGYDEYKDKKPEQIYYSEMASMFNHCPSVVVHYPESLYKIAQEMGVIPNRVVSWVYNSNTPRQHRDIAYFGISPIFDGLGEFKNPTDKRIAKRISEGKKPKGYDWIYVDQVKNVSKGTDAHPCEMPLEVMIYIINTLPLDSTIIDPYMGSGTTCLAAKRTGRHYIGIEMSKHYFQIAQDRIMNDSPLFDYSDFNHLPLNDEQCRTDEICTRNGLPVSADSYPPLQINTTR